MQLSQYKVGGYDLGEVEARVLVRSNRQARRCGPDTAGTTL